ncbi:hypothetical protein [Massilibacteroides sp.]|uniref:hypothetical protein n=1 Tax=Massilibacteroides sp. TaxID=2034766 RepID=UPI002635DE6E|nr:hypothetical protein [Massilibacteroides sp.]MDD4515413.1 hypothetical protein [Massilibacteroides sp.]
MSELKIKIGDTWAETNGLEIPVVLRSPVFSGGKGSFIFNFQLPATPAMKKELGYFHRPGRFGSNSISKPLLLTFGLLRYAGTANVVSTSEYEYEVSCPIDNSDLAMLFKSKKLNELDLGGIRNETENPIRAKATMENDVNIAQISQIPFDYTFIPAFSVISKNPYNELQISGNKFISSMTGTISLKFEIVVQEVVSEMNWLRVYKNGVPFFTPNFIETGIRTVDVTVTIGDEITWDIYLKSDGPKPAILHIILFSMLQSSNIEIMLSNIELATNGLNLYPHSDYACFPLENNKMFDNIDDDTYQVDHVSAKEIYSNYFTVQNYYVDNKFKMLLSGYANDDYFVAYNLFVPFPYLAYVMNRVFETFDISVQNNVFTDIDMRQLVIFNTYAENNFISNDLISPTPGIDLKDHVPEVLISDYFTNLCKFFGIAFDYRPNSRTIRLKYLKDIASDTDFQQFPGIITTTPELSCSAYKGFRLIQSTNNDDFIRENFKSLDGLSLKGSVNTVSDLTEIEDPKINDCYYVNANKEYWIYNYDPEVAIITWLKHTNDFFFQYEYIDENHTGEMFEIKTNINPIMNNSYPFRDTTPSSPLLRKWLIPNTAQPGNFDGLPDFFKSDFSNSLLYYHGLRKDSTDNLYPFASCDIYDYSGNPISFENSNPYPAYTHALSLRWDGPNGIYEKRYKAWIDLMMKSRGTFKLKAYLSPNDLAKIDFLKWYTAPGYRFMIKEIRFTISDKHISIAELDVFVR